MTTIHAIVAAVAMAPVVVAASGALTRRRPGPLVDPAAEAAGCDAEYERLCRMGA